VTGRLIAADQTAASSAFHAADVGEIVPVVGRIEYIPALKELVTKHRVGLLVPLTDLDLRILARHRDAFAEIGCTVMIGEERDVKACRDKAASNGLFAAAGLDVIKTVTLSDFRDDPFYPCFVKPIRGSGGVGTGTVRNKSALEAHVATYGKRMLVQEYVPGREYTIDVYRDRAGTVRAVVPRQRLAVRAGEVSKGITVRDPALTEAAERLAAQLGATWGVFCCQCRRPQDGRPRFFEVNPRFGGGVPLSIAAGANMPLYLLQEALGRPVTARMGKFTPDLMMLRYDDALFVKADEPEKLPGYDSPVFR